jgi:hypothetical protein
MTEVAKLVIKNVHDKNDLVMALVNSGYLVYVEEKRESITGKILGWLVEVYKKDENIS